MDRSTLLRRLPNPYADALRLHDRGLDDRIPGHLGIEPESVPALLALAETKLARLQDAECERDRSNEGSEETPSRSA